MRLVHIVNRDSIAGRFFLIRSVDSPRITAANVVKKGPCVIDKGLYRAKCTGTLAPGKALDIHLTKSGGGTINVFACPSNTYCLRG